MGTVLGLKFGILVAGPVSCLSGTMSTIDVEVTRLVSICINLSGGKPFLNVWVNAILMLCSVLNVYYGGAETNTCLIIAGS